MMIAGQVVYEDGEFTLIDRNVILTQISEVLAKPRDAEELERHQLRADVFPVVEDLYAGYLQNTVAREASYKVSSRT